MTDLIKYQGASKVMAKSWRDDRIYLWNKGQGEKSPDGKETLSGYWLCNGYALVRVFPFAKILQDRAIFPELPDVGTGMIASKSFITERAVPTIDQIIPLRAYCRQLTLTPWLYMVRGLGNCFVLEFEDNSITIINSAVMAVLGETEDDLDGFSFFAKDAKSAVLVQSDGATFAVLMPVWKKDDKPPPPLPTFGPEPALETKVPAYALAAAESRSVYISIAATDAKGRPMTILQRR